MNVVYPEHLTLARSLIVEDWFGPETAAIDQMLKRNSAGSDRWIADHAAMILDRGPYGVSPDRVAERRIVLAGAIPKVDHAGIIRALALHAWHLGFAASPERAISLPGNRRVIPDLVVGEPDQPVRWVVEVKSILATRTHIRAAAKQAARYAEVTGGQPIVTTYAPTPVDRVGDVLFMTASAVRATFAAASREIREAA